MIVARIFFLVLILFNLTSAQAQLSDVQSKKIDSLFSSWTKDNHPGGSIGIMQYGKIVYSKAFGAASLGYQIPNTKETTFNIASVSKQFTAMGIVRLHEKGLLSVDDDIHKYLPDLPDFGHPITIRHLLHHTSGMRSFHAILHLAGWEKQDKKTNEDIYRLMLKQKELNFTPGDKFLYCNTGYVLMAKIIESVTNEQFPQWMKSNIFEPLGMKNTFIEDKYDRVILNSATPYYGLDIFYKAVKYGYYSGSGNQRSTTPDLLKWLQNFSTPTPNWSSSFKMLQTTDTLNNGNENDYAFGIRINDFKNHTKISHNGGGGGWKSSISHYPDTQLSIAILTNFSSSRTKNIERNIADILLKEKPNTEEKTVTPTIPNSNITFSPQQLVGKYKTPSGYSIHVNIKNDSLYVFQEWDKTEYHIYNTNGNIYETPEKQNTQFVFSKLKDNSAQIFSQHFKGKKIDAERYVNEDLSNINLNNYTGRFYSPELESVIHIKFKDDKLIAKHIRLGDFQVQLTGKNSLTIKGLGTVDIIRNSKHIITGMRISNRRALNVWFEKQDNNNTDQL